MEPTHDDHARPPGDRPSGPPPRPSSPPASPPGPGSHTGQAPAPGLFTRRRALFGLGAIGLVAVSAGVTVLTRDEGSPSRAEGADPAEPGVGATTSATSPAPIRPWRGDVAGGEKAAPAVGGGLVFANGGDDLHAFEATTGVLKWRAPAGETRFTSPAVAAGTVYSHGGSVYAFDAATGAPKWKVAMDNSSWPVATSDTVYVSDGGTLHALEAAGGRTRWSFPAGDRTFHPPVVVDARVYASNGDGLYALDAATGSGKWRFADAVESPPVTAGRIVAGYAQSIAENTSMAVFGLDAASGERVWSHPIAGEGAGITATDRAVFVTFDTTVTALAAETGALLWEASVPATGAPIVSGDTVYVTAGDTLVALDAGTGAPRWTFATGAGGEGSPPVIAAGAAYFQCGGALYAVDAASGAGPA